MVQFRPLTAAAAFLVLQFAGLCARADTFPVEEEDPLHGFCWGSSSCSDNGTNTPTSSNPPHFGFTISPGPQTGNFYVDILVPNNLVAVPSSLSYSITGTQGGAANNAVVSATATLFSATAWTTGMLNTYLGNGASPANPIGAYLPSTQTLDSGATGFFVYQANLGINQLKKNSDALLGPLLDIGNLIQGSYIIGFLAVTTTKKGVTTTSYIATANSAAIFETGLPPPPPAPPPVPLPGALLLMGTVLAGGGAFGAWRRRRAEAAVLTTA